MAQPTQLTPTEQDALVKQIGLAMLRVAPEDWEQLTVDYRAVGRYAESTGQVTYSDGSSEPWAMPADLQGLFARLRAGMYREGRGTWFNARYKLDHPSSYNLEYDREEPGWDIPPPPQAYPDDMRMFPRTDDNVPEWLRRRLATAPPPGPLPGPPPPMPDRAPGPPRFRVARIFDGPGEDGRPSVNRPQVDEMDIQDILDYLDNGPLVGPARGYDVDRLDPNGQQSVPVAFHTDGTWIWPAAVNYYLREHDVAPEPDLVEHIRRMRFQLPQVDEATRGAAQAFLGPPPPGPGPRPGPPPAPAPAPTRAMPVPAPVPAPKMPPMTPPRAALPSQGPASAEIDHLRARLEDLDVPETAYRVGQPSGRGWTMEQTDEGWRVGWYDQDWVAPAVFEDVADASAFLLGKLLLDTDRWAAGPKNPELPPLPPPPPDHGFEPVPAPAEDFEPMSAPIEEFTQGAGPGRPPGSREFGSPGRDDFAAAGSGRDFGGPGDFASAGAGRAAGRDTGPGRDFGAPDDFGAGRDAGSGREFGAPGPGRDDAGAGPGRDFGSPGANRDDFAAGPGQGRDFGSPDDFASSGANRTAGRDEFGAPGRDTGPGRDFGAPEDFANGSGRDAGPGQDFGSPGRNDFANGSGGSGRDFGSPGDFASSGRDEAERDEFGAGRNEFGGSGREEFGTRIVGPPPGTPGFTPPAGPVGPPPGTPGFTPPPGTPPRGEPAHTMAMEPPSPPRGEQQVRPTNGAASAPPGSEWPINPLPGEPPLTLFRGKRMIELEPGTEIDRFGDDDGNLVYAAGTPFTERSLVPEWVDRPYHVYRVRQPVQALTGAAIPWFDQPGGGTAFLLPDAIGDLVAQGQLVEVDSGEPPRS